MVNTIWKENFLIMCSKLCLNARDSGHFAQLLLICRNYSLQTLCGAPHNVCNEEGKILHLPLNRPYVEGDVFAGVFFVCGLEDGEFVSLTDEQYARFEAEYHWPILFGESILGLIPLRCTPEQYAQHMGQDARRDTPEPEHDER